VADIQPFKGIRYNRQLSEDIGQLLCPPYDVISPERQERLHQSSPYNAVRLELGMDTPDDSAESNRYTRASRLLEEWLGEGVLLPEEDPSFYLLQEEFSHRGRVRSRRSLVTRVRLEEFSRGIVLPHEETSQGPKKDRLELLTATEANLSPLMAIYRSPAAQVGAIIDEAARKAPLVDTIFDGMGIKLWRIADEATVDTIRESLKDAPIYMADGHHRYETALRYREILKDGGAQEGGHDFVLMSLLEIEDPGLVVLPYHRLLRGLSPEQLAEIERLVGESFDVQTLDSASANGADVVPLLEDRLEEIAASRVALGLLDSGSQSVSLLTLKEQPGASASPLERCATWLLEKLVLGPVLGTQSEAVDRGLLYYSHDSEEVSSGISSGDVQLGFVLPPLSLDVFEEVVLSGERMPIKSTYFSPKLPTGLVINRLV
jgi:uncharacterized protein (DUF1015 family)